MSVRDARNLRFDMTDDESVLPMTVRFQGLKPWPSAIYLKVHPDKPSRLKDIVNRIQGLPAKRKTSCDHLSLYRKRNANPQVFKKDVESIRKAIEDFEWGSVQGVSIRIKVVGTAGYDECKVLLP
jgi:hypothetical protein